MMSIVRVLMERDHYTKEEAIKEVLSFREDLLNGEFDYPEDAFMEEFGLEPDYLIDIL